MNIDIETPKSLFLTLETYHMFFLNIHKGLHMCTKPLNYKAKTLITCPINIFKAYAIPQTCLQHISTTKILREVFGFDIETSKRVPCWMLTL